MQGTPTDVHNLEVQDGGVITQVQRGGGNAQVPREKRVKSIAEILNGIRRRKSERIVKVKLTK